MARKIHKVNTLINDMFGNFSNIEDDPKEVSLEKALFDMADMFDFQTSKFKRSKQTSKDELWEFEPVGPLDFITGEDYLNLKEEMYPVVLEDLVDSFPDNPKQLQNKYKEIVFDEAIGSGKCKIGSTEILLSDGNIKTIEEIFESKEKVLELFSLNEKTNKLEKQFSSDVVCNGIKDVWKLTTRCGREITVTDNDRFIINGIWKELKDIKIKEFVAVPAKIEIEGIESLSDDEVKIIAYTLGDGCCVSINAIGFASIDKETRIEFEECFNNINKLDSVHLEDYYKDYSKNPNECYGLVLRGKNKKESEISKLFDKTGILFHKANNKFIPKEIKMSTERQIGLFLNRLWSTDGSVDITGCGVGYGTISKQLAKDVAFCLSRLGIRYNLSTRKRKIKPGQYKTITGEFYTSYEIWPITEDTPKFFEKVGFIIGKKYNQCIKCLENFNNKERNTNIDCIPLDYKTTRFYAIKAGYNGLEGNLKQYKMGCNFSRTKFKQFMKEECIKDLNEPLLNVLNSDDIFWDRIEKIEYIGKEKVYDISMPIHHNFIANDIITHNSFKLSILAVYMVYKLLCLRNPQRFFKLAPGSKIAIMNMSVSASQARRVVFGEIKNKIDYSKFFKKYYPPNPRIKSELQFDASPDVVKEGDIRVYKNVFIIPGSSSGFAPLGYNLFCGIIDEATLWRDTENKDYVEEVYDIIKRRITSRFMNDGLIVLGGSPMYSTDFLERRIKDVIDNNIESVLVRRRSHWDAKYPNYNGPTFYFHLEDCKLFETESKMLDYREKVITRAKENWSSAKELFDTQIKKIPMMYYNDFKKNPEGSKRDLGGWPSDSISVFIENSNYIDENINKLRVDPVSMPFIFKKWFAPKNKNAWHCIHIDLAITGNACGICMGHPEGYNEDGGVITWIDFIMKIQGTIENPVQIEQIREMIYMLSRMGFPIGKITMDGFQSVDNMQILAKRGYIVEYLSVDKTMTPYIEWKEALYQNRINTYFNETRDREVRKLEKIKNKKIDHPRGGSKDLADAECGVVYSCIAVSKWDPPSNDEDENQVLKF